MKQIGAGRRLIAASIDMLPIYALGTLIGNEAYSRLIVGTTINDRPVLPQYVLLCLISGIVISFLFYHVVCENIFNRSIGKFLMNFKLGNADGGRIGIKRSLTRNLLKINPYTTYTLFLNNPPLHDKVTNVELFSSANAYSVLSNWIKNLIIISCVLGVLFILFKYGIILQHIINIFILICVAVSVIGFIVRIISNKN